MLSQPQGLSEAGRIMSMKNSNDTMGNRTHDLRARNAVPQPQLQLGFWCISFVFDGHWFGCLYIYDAEGLIASRNK